MTARYIGMSRSTGQALTDTDHIRQSIGDILRTPIGSRVMRRNYGSLLSAMIDQPQTPRWSCKSRRPATWRSCAGSHALP